MRRLGSFVFAAVICLAVVGYFRDWFTISGRSHGTVNDKVGVTLTVDPDKVKADVTAVKDKTVKQGSEH